jgi:hypothetical protein
VASCRNFDSGSRRHEVNSSDPDPRITLLLSTDDPATRKETAISLMDEYLETGDETQGRALDRAISKLLRDPKTDGYRGVLLWIAYTCGFLQFETLLLFKLFATGTFEMKAHTSRMLEKQDERLSWRAMLRMAAETIPLTKDDKPYGDTAWLMTFCAAPARVTFLAEGGRKTPVSGASYACTTLVNDEMWSVHLDFDEDNEGEKTLGDSIPCSIRFLVPNAPHKHLAHVSRVINLYEGPKFVGSAIICDDYAK